MDRELRDQMADIEPALYIFQWINDPKRSRTESKPLIPKTNTLFIRPKDPCNAVEGIEARPVVCCLLNEKAVFHNQSMDQGSAVGSAHRQHFMERRMAAAGFGPAPLRTGAWSQYLRPFSQMILKYRQVLQGGCYRVAAVMLEFEEEVVV